ncbi:uncharacterized protein LOC131994749 [Stomoxys calcitrans]|uniref:uncharacterized protein LOC131994749 n=1 Tax=Stomoxys calcitrans TaxID=35570 RepID=UPI0027E2C35E|nr:uncharacterized protein LOC131994749 [Stomoxys calcitrans]
MPGAAKVICVACNETIAKNGSIRCRICSGWLHASCAKLSEKDLIALKAIKVSAFICTTCEGKIGSSGCSNDGGSIAGDIRALNEKFDDFLAGNRDELNSIKTVLGEIKTEMSSCLKEIKSDIDTCNKRIDDVASSCSTKIAALEVGMNILHRRINRTDIVIDGLPTNLKDLYAVVIALGTFFKIPITSNDINNVCYMHNRKLILVKFNSVQLRDSIMREYFATRSLKVSDVNGT